MIPFRPGDRVRLKSEHELIKFEKSVGNTSTISSNIAWYLEHLYGKYVVIKEVEIGKEHLSKHGARMLLKPLDDKRDKSLFDVSTKSVPAGLFELVKPYDRTKFNKLLESL